MIKPSVGGLPAGPGNWWALGERATLTTPRTAGDSVREGKGSVQLQPRFRPVAARMHAFALSVPCPGSRTGRDLGWEPAPCRKAPSPAARPAGLGQGGRCGWAPAMMLYTHNEHGDTQLHPSVFQDARYMAALDATKVFLFLDTRRRGPGSLLVEDEGEREEGA